MWKRAFGRLNRKRESVKKEHEKELDELKRLRQENEVLTKKIHKLEKKVKRLENRKSNKTSTASTCTTVTVVKEADKEEETSGINEDYVYEAGERTIYDCIQEGKQLGLDMRVINDKLGYMEVQEFIEWFDTFKEENS